MHKSLEMLSIEQVSLGLMLIVMSGCLMRLAKIPLIKDLAYASLRTIFQLLVIGYILALVFQSQNWMSVILYLGIMSSVAGFTIMGRLPSSRKRNNFWPIHLSLWLGTGITLAWVTRIILQVHPWYNPQFLIPLAGMLLGNSVNSATLALERFYSEVESRHTEIETLLSLGATPKQAIYSCFKAGVMAGMIPNINAMMIVGIVSLPGMMTGQILAGQLPLQAVGYQMVVMFMITAASAFTLFLLLGLARHKVFNQYEQLQLSDSEN